MEKDHAVAKEMGTKDPSAPDENAETLISSSEKKIRNNIPLYRLYKFADAFDVLLMICGGLGSIVHGLGFPLMTLLIGSFINLGYNSESNQNSDELVFQFVYLSIAIAIGSYFQRSCWTWAGERQAARMRDVYLKAILRQDIAFFDMEITTAEVVETMSGDITHIQEAIGEKVGIFIQHTTKCFGGFIVAFIRGWKLTLVLLAVLPLLIAMGAGIAKIKRDTASQVQKAYEKASIIAEQTISAIHTVVSFCGEEKAINRYDQFLKPAYNAAVHQGLASGLGMGLFMFIMYCTYALALWYGAELTINEGYSGGKVVTVIFAVLSGAISLGELTPSINAFSTGQAVAYKMFEALKKKPQIDASDITGIVLGDIHGDIELKDVYFSYPSRTNVQIFSGLSLRMPSGSTTAIVGKSGSGKSTVLSLIERFFDPQSGEVLIDGINIKEFRLKWIRQKIGLVSQEPVLFATTIAENIAYGREDATLDDIKAAADVANAAEFISKMPRGFETIVGENGALLSGGQKQRVAIARALLKNPRILLLDEATSASDMETEKAVQEALSGIMEDRTTVVVAHRLTTVRNADSIAVLQNGCTVERGPHSELIRSPLGVYFQMVSLQKLHESNKHDKEEFDNLEIVAENVLGKVSSSKSSFKQLSVDNQSSIFKGSQIGSDLASGVCDDKSIQERNLKSSLLSWISRKATKRDIENGYLSVQKSVPILKLALLNKPEIHVLILGSIAAAIVALSYPLFALLFSSILTSFFEPPHKLRKDARFWSLMFVVLAIIMLVMAPMQYSCFGLAGGKLVQRIRSVVFRQILYQEIEWFDYKEHTSGAIVSRLSTDAANVRSMVGDALSLLVQNVATVLGGIVIAFTANWKLAFPSLVLIPLLGIEILVQLKFLKGSADAKVEYEEANQIVHEAVGSIRTIASFNAEEKVLELYNKKRRASVAIGKKKGFLSGLVLGFSNAFLFALNTFISWMGTQMVRNGETTFGDVFKVIFAVTMAAVGVSHWMALTPDMSKVKNSVNSVFQTLNKKSKIDASDVSGNIIENIEGRIEFLHVNFRYPTRPDVQIFRDMSILFPSCKTAALVGESGSGKSTVIALLQRFYNPDSGNILIDGVEIQNIQIKWLRQQMGLVNQEPVLFDDTVQANISYGKDGLVSEEQIIKAAVASNAHNFISALPQGYGTRVGERGVQLSGGQKQRIAIARAILKDPKILLLDEATSALDAESERVVQDALDRVKSNRTTIVVAHRLSTIKDADMICVLKNGSIVERGRHDELLNTRGGVYAASVRLHMDSM